MSTGDNLSLYKEIQILLSLALPTSAVQFFLYFLFAQIASNVGLQLGTVELASFSLASLTGNLLCLSTIIGSLSAADTLMPRAFGLEQYEEIGRLAIRGFVVCSLVLLPITIPLIFSMEEIFLALGQDPAVSQLASKWLRVYVCGVPFVLLFRDMQRFLAAQNLVMPMVYGSFIGNMAIAPFVVKTFVQRFGFLGSAFAIVIIQILQVAISLSYVVIFRPHHPRSWPGIVTLWGNSIKMQPLLSFLSLSTGGVISFTEWWFWESICFVAGRFGIIPFCVHTIAYNLVPLSYMLILGFAMALCIRMGALFSKNVENLKRLVSIAMLFTLLFSGCIGISIYTWKGSIIRLFTDDEEVIEGCDAIWGKITIHIILLYFYCVNSYISRAFGQQWRLAGIVAVVLWLLTLPTILYVCIYRGGGLNAMWTIIPSAYFVLNCSIMVNNFLLTDWDEVANEIKAKKEADSVDRLINENTSLLKNDLP